MELNHLGLAVPFFCLTTGRQEVPQQRQCLLDWQQCGKDSSSSSRPRALSTMMMLLRGPVSSSVVFLAPAVLVMALLCGVVLVFAAAAGCGGISVGGGRRQLQCVNRCN